MRQGLAASIALPLCFLNITFGLLTPVLNVLNGLSLFQLIDAMAGPLLAISFSIVGAVVASRRPRNPIGWIFCVIGFSQGLVSFAYAYATYSLITAPGSLPGGGLMSWLGQLAWIPGLHLLLTYGLLLFPNGSLPSARWRVVAWVSIIPFLIFLPLAAGEWSHRGRALMENPGQFEPTGFAGVLAAALFPLMLFCGLASLLSIFVRFVWSRDVERQQLKWVTYAAALTFTAIVVENYHPVFQLLLVIVVPSIPIAAGMAILRYRLYDVDIIIRRTLVYSLLSGALALVYFGTIVAMQHLFRTLTGQESQLAIVVSTLAIAALFNPLRYRIQGFIDQRFYRRKYDAQETLAAFSASMQSAANADLEHLTGELVGVIEETVQPSYMSIWLLEEPNKVGRAGWSNL